MNRLVWVGAALAVVSAAPAAAQTTPNLVASGLKMQRQELEALLAQREAEASSDAYSSTTRARARRDAELIRERLTLGDFRLGDRIILVVEGEILPDTVRVEPGPKITLEKMGEISLAGVLRSELEDHLTRELSHYIQRPRVRAAALINLGIFGVGGGGFFTVPADMLLTEALMYGGALGANADLKNLRIQRTGRVLWEGEELQQVLAEGRTLDQLNLQAGDQITVPAVPADGSTLWRVVRWVVPAAASIFFGIRVFGIR